MRGERSHRPRRTHREAAAYERHSDLRVRHGVSFGVLLEVPDPLPQPVPVEQIVPVEKGGPGRLHPRHPEIARRADVRLVDLESPIEPVVKARDLVPRRRIDGKEGTDQCGVRDDPLSMKIRDDRHIRCGHDRYGLRDMSICRATRAMPASGTSPRDSSRHTA